MRRATSNGTNDNAPNVNRVALKNNGDMESMPWTCETNASPQINAVNIRQPMPAISFFCISHHRKRNRRERKRSDRNTVRPNYCTITRYLPNNSPAGCFAAPRAKHTAKRPHKKHATRASSRRTTRRRIDIRRVLRNEETAQKTRNACVLKAHNTKAYRHTSSVVQRRGRSVACFFTRGCREAEEYTRTCSRSRDTDSGRKGWRSS